MCAVRAGVVLRRGRSRGTAVSPTRVQLAGDWPAHNAGWLSAAMGVAWSAGGPHHAVSVTAFAQGSIALLAPASTLVCAMRRDVGFGR
jgi:hypothetical protein